MGKTFHIQCYKCEVNISFYLKNVKINDMFIKDCSMQLGDEQDRRCYPIDDTLLCQGCCRRRLVCVNKF